MKLVFADTSYWMAVLNPRDQLSPKAILTYREISPDAIVTSEMVLAELLNNLGSKGVWLRAAGVGAVETMRQQADVIIVSQTAEQFEAALQRYKRSADKEWSLADCVSFLIMEERGIRAALTHDQHFVQAGFEALLR